MDDSQISLDTGDDSDSESVCESEVETPKAIQEEAVSAFYTFMWQYIHPYP